MKHKLSITLLLLSMFILTQLIGIVVLDYYQTHELPFGLQMGINEPQPGLPELSFSFLIAFALIFLLMKYKWKLVMKLWFFFVILMAIGVIIYIFFGKIEYQLYALLIALPIAIWKVFKNNVIIHNLTELLIYPGIAAIFVQFLSPLTIIGLLILISIYDMWAVWQSGIMQQMAKFQMEELKVFGGFLLPSTSNKVKMEISRLRTKYEGKTMPKSVRNKKFKIGLAILGGGDVVFPIIASGIFLKAYGIIPALFIMGGALAGLAFLFSITKKDRAYPAMPYISVGIFVGMLLWKVLM